MGGIQTGRDALEFILAGASAVSVGTAIFHDPTAPIRILAELEAELDKRGFDSVADAVAFAHRSVEEQTDFFASRSVEASA
jgi:dihydroorotate dehydrogenase (NAD+) catalytic subunit